MKIYINELIVEQFEKKIKSFERRCKRLGLPFSCEKIGERFSFYYRDVVFGINGAHAITEIVSGDDTETIQALRQDGTILYPFKEYAYEVEEITAKHEGNYEVIAKLEITPNGNVVYNLMDKEVPQRFYNSESYCDCCKTKRRRKFLFVILNKETNEYFQVGSECMLNYSFGISSEHIAWYYESLSKLIYTDKEDLSGNERVGEYILGGGRYFDVRDVLYYAVALTKLYGYIPADSNDYSTKSLTYEVLRRIKRGDSKDEVIFWLNNHANKNKNLESRRFDEYFNTKEEEIDEVVNYYLEQEPTSDFIHNIQILLKNNYINSAHIGYIACLPHCYKKAIEEQEREKRLESQPPFYFGKVGKRYTIDRIDSSEIITSWSNGFGGYVTLWKIKSGDYVFVWKSSSTVDNDDFENAKSFTFTVKAHSKFGDERQTEITRARLS